MTTTLESTLAQNVVFSLTTVKRNLAEMSAANPAGAVHVNVTLGLAPPLLCETVDVFEPPEEEQSTYLVVLGLKMKC